MEFYAFRERILPSRVKVTTSSGMSFPTLARAVRTARSKPPAAGDFHAGDGNGANIVGSEKDGELFGIVPFIQLRAADQRDLPGHKAVVEVCVA